MKPVEPFASFRTLSDLPKLVRHFVRDPVGTMKLPMRLTWPAALTLQAGSAMLSGVIAGAFAQSFGDFLAGLLIFPLASCAIGVLFAAYFYYLFSLFFATFLDFRRLHSIVTVSTMPYFLLHAFSSFVAPMDLIGFALTAMLLIVGLAEQFSLEKRVVVKIVSALCVVFFLVWSVAQIQTTGVDPTSSRMPTSSEGPAFRALPSDSAIQEWKSVPSTETPAPQTNQ